MKDLKSLFSTHSNASAFFNSEVKNKQPKNAFSDSESNSSELNTNSKCRLNENATSQSSTCSEKQQTGMRLKRNQRPTNLNLKIITSPANCNSQGGAHNATATAHNAGNSSQSSDTADFSSCGAMKRHDIGFKDLTYTVKAGIIKRENKTILNKIYGNFKAGDLTAIMGPSGAGKSSLLNILSGYTTMDYTGQITVNGCQRDLKRFLRQSAYIMQDHDLQPYLTVDEAMYFSVNLKIGNEMSQVNKKQRITQILKAIGMRNSRKTRTCNLSGGQKKRLAIALELVNNPPVLLLDEPTSGLDSSTSTQCVSLLKKLAQEGRTVICTIHQPSALVFGMFDHLFAIADGQCIYSGGTEHVVSFLAELNLKCPESYNPSDYLLEISTSDYGYVNDKLVEKIENGRCDFYRKNEQSTAQIAVMDQIERMMERGIITPVRAPAMSSTYRSQPASPRKPPLASIVEFSSSLWGSSGFIDTSMVAEKLNANGQYAQQENSSTIGTPDNTPTYLGASSTIDKTGTIKKLKLKAPNIPIDPSKFCKQDDRYALSFWRQLYLLLMRTFLILWRDRSLTRTRLIIHAVMGTFIGTLYFGIGNDASHMLNNFKYIFFSIMFLMFTTFSATTLNFPLEFPIVSREHFNRWYSLRAYYVAITLADVPIQLICTMIFIGISYIMTNQPLELFRVSLFFVMCSLACLVSQSIGLVVGASLSVKNGAVFGPFFICPFLIFSGFFVQMRDVHTVMHWLFHISFLKHALEGSALAIFGYGRPKMECKEIFCMYVRPERFLKFLDMQDGSFLTGTLALTIIFFVLRFLAFYIMLFRLKLQR